MMMRQQLQLTLCALIAIAIFSLTACGPANPEATAVSDANKQNIQRLANLYTLHQSQNQYEGPQDESAFKEFIKKTDPRRLDMMGIDPNGIEELFVSERDGEQFKIRYGIRSGPHGCTEPAIFEATGSGGKRMVGFLNMVQKEVDNAEYDNLFAGGSATEATVTSSRKSGDDRSSR